MKKTKIISERVNTQFKEVEKQEKEENLEEEIENEQEENFNDFPEFVSGERTAPVLEQNPIPDTEPLEQDLEKVPSSNKIKTQTDYITNIPDYSGNVKPDYETATERREFEVKDISEFSRQRETDRFEIMPSQDFSQLSQEERTEREIRRYQEPESRFKEEEERRVPFDRRERKRERILK